MPMVGVVVLEVVDSSSIVAVEGLTVCVGTIVVMMSSHLHFSLGETLSYLIHCTHWPSFMFSLLLHFLLVI